MVEGELPPGPTPPPNPEPTSIEDESGPVGRRIVERFMAIGGTLSPPSRILDKLDTRLIGKLFDQAEEESKREHARQMRSMTILGIWVGSIPILIGLLCWLFLYYGKSEQVEKIIALVVGAVGGFGIGRASKDRGAGQV